MEIQTRDVHGSLKFFEDIKEAFDYADSNDEVWKISFSGVRLVKESDGQKKVWRYEPMEKILGQINLPPNLRVLDSE